MSLPDISLQQLLQRVAAYALVIGVYGLVGATLVRAFGDAGPKHDGRQTANPLVHLDVLALLATIFFRVPWMKPLEVDATALHRPRFAAPLVVVLSSLTIIAFGAVCLAARPAAVGLVGGDAAIVVSNLLLAAFELSVAAALLNILPLPPLTGTLWIALIDPRRHAWLQGRRVRWLGALLIALGLLFGIVTPPLRAATAALRAAIGY